MSETWQPIESAPEYVIVQTKNDAHPNGVEQPLWRKGGLWHFPKGSLFTYVGYVPTHWRLIDNWQPIESAPLDGSLIWVRCEGKEMSMWHSHLLGWMVPPTWWHWSDRPAKVYPSEWMPTRPSSG